jgi:hypothetical protein
MNVTAHHNRPMSDLTPATRPQCANCGKPAFWALNDFPICIDCKYKHDQSQWMEFAKNATMINHLEREMTNMVGMPHLANGIAIPAAPIPPINYNHQAVTVSGGTVGAVNFGNVHDIQVNLQTLSQVGSTDLVEPMQKLTEAVLNAQDTDEAMKNELLEQIAALTAQASEKPEARKSGTVKAMFAAIKEGAGAIGSVAGAWEATAPLLKAHFGI